MVALWLVPGCATYEWGYCPDGEPYFRAVSPRNIDNLDVDLDTGETKLKVRAGGIKNPTPEAVGSVAGAVGEVIKKVP